MIRCKDCRYWFWDVHLNECSLFEQWWGLGEMNRSIYNKYFNQSGENTNCPYYKRAWWKFWIKEGDEKK